MNLHVLLTMVAAGAMSVSGTPSAYADKREVIEVRQINTAPRLIGCSSAVISCDGATSIRTGLVVVDVVSRHVRRGPVALVGMFHAAARPREGLLSSQAFVAAGPRVTLGRNWVQGGLGLAGRRIAPGPKTIPVATLLDAPSPAVVLGVGRRLAAFDVPIQISLDFGTNLGVRDDDQLGDVYQVTANLFATDI